MMRLPKYLYVIRNGEQVKCVESTYDVKQYIDELGDCNIDLIVWKAKVERMSVYRHEHYDREDED